MAKTHYETLEVNPRSTQDQIRSAYRKIVLVHHPDRSSSPESKEIFMKSTEAYDVLSDPAKRRQYDESLRLERLRQNHVQSSRNQASPSSRTSSASRTETKGNSSSSAKPGYGGHTEPTVPKSQGIPTKAQYKTTSGSAAVSLEVTRLTMLFNRGHLLDAEKLAHKILSEDPRQPIPYAVLGDLYKQKGMLAQAAEQYALAVQMDPANEIYRVRHEELLAAVYPGDRALTGSDKNPIPAVLTAAAVALLGAGYLAISPERPFAPGMVFISHWTLGLISWLIVGGVAIGIALSRSNLVDRLSLLTKGAVKGSSSQSAIVYLSVIFFWLGTAIYVFRGLSQNAMNPSWSRVYSSCAGVLLLYSLGLAISGNPALAETLLWGGNLLFLSALGGWAVTDALKGEG